MMFRVSAMVAALLLVSGAGAIASHGGAGPGARNFAGWHAGYFWKLRYLGDPLVALEQRGRVLPFHDGAVNAAIFPPRRRFTTSGEDARIAIWTPGEPQTSKVLEGHEATVVALAMSPDGSTLASAS